MGIYDRPYYGETESSSWLAARPMVINLILLNVAIYVADLIFDGQIRQALCLKSDLLSQPWNCWQLVTYGFVHDEKLPHILFNMFFLWMFGTELEGIYGRMEFLRFYLLTIVVAGLVWVGVDAATGAGPAKLLGASGGVMGLMILYVLRFPRRIFYIWGIIPLPAWGLGLMFVIGDLVGMAHPEGNQVANVAHLAGVAFGFAYYQGHWNLGRLVPRRLSSASFRWRPKLRIHDPDQSTNLNEKVDEILEKISQQGEASLTKKERRTLEEASRRYQRRRE